MTKRIRNTEKIKIDNNLQKFLSYGEIIKPIPNFPNYFITNTGRVFSGKYKVEYDTIRGESFRCVVWRELKKRIINGYYAINIMSDESKKKTKYIHYLVYISFHTELFDNRVLKIIHLNGNKLDNHVSNLRVTFRKKDDYQAHKNYVYRAKMYSNIDKTFTDFSTSITK